MLVYERIQLLNNKVHTFIYCGAFPFALICHVVLLSIVRSECCAHTHARDLHRAVL